MKHEIFKFYGPKQGAECECGEVFYPKNGSHAAQKEAFAQHCFLVGAPPPSFTRE